MAIFRPVMSSGDSFFGICEIAIKEFKDRSSEFDWADMFIDVTINQKSSEYTRNIKIAGSFEKDAASGNIIGGSVLKRMYVFFDAIGCKAGLNIKGKWEDENGEPIADIAKYLNDNCIDDSFPDDTNYNYLAYIYKEKPKKDGDKAWTRVYHKIYANNEANKAKLNSDVSWLKGKGVIKEAVDLPVNNSGGNSLQGSGLSNL